MTPSEATSRRPGVSRLLRCVCWSLPLLVCVLIAYIPSESYVVNLVTDDALYYPTIARSIVMGGGSSYDGITQTNGYHPLWLWLELPVAALAGRLEPLTYLWFIKLFMCGVVLLALMVWERLIQRVTRSGWLTSTIVLLLGSYWWSIYTLYSGLETPLVILLMGTSVLLAHRLLSSDTPSPCLLLSLAVAMAATFLARLDTVFFLAVLGVPTLIGLKRNIQRALIWLVPMILLPLPYLWWNLSNFGSIVPVSGLKKTVVGINLALQYNIFAKFWLDKLAKALGFLHPVGAVILLIAIAVALYFLRRQIGDQLKRLSILWVVPICALLHYGYTSIFMSEGDIYWYQYSEYLTAFLMLAVVVAAAAAWLRAHARLAVAQWLPITVVLIGVLAVLTLYVPRKLPNQVNLQAYRTAVWARGHVDSESGPRFGMVDSGIFRFVSGFKTLSLNGLAGDRQLLELVRQEALPEIINHYKLNYVTYFYPTEKIVGIPPNYVLYRSDPYTYVRRGQMLVIDAAYWSAR